MSSDSLGFVRVGDLNLALAADDVEEVAHGPFVVHPLPAACPYLIGAITLRKSSMPVLNLQALFSEEPVGERIESVGKVAVLSQNGLRIALRIDDVFDVRRVEESQITRVEDSSEFSVFSKVYTCPESGRVSALLDMESLEKLDGVRRFESARVKERRVVAVEGKAKSIHVIFRCEDTRFAVQSQVIHQVEKEPTVLDSKLQLGSILGFHEYRGKLLAYLDLRNYLGFGSCERSGRRMDVVILGSSERSVALLVDEVETMQHFDLQERERFDGFGYAKPEYLKASVVAGDGSLVLVLDEQRLLRDLGRDGCFSQVDKVRSKSERVGGESIRKPIHYLVYEAAGCLFATSLSDLEAVIECPENFRETPGASEAFKGTCSYLNRGVKVFSSSELLDLERSDSESETLFLLVRSSSGLIAFSVEKVRFLQWAVSTVIPCPGSPRSLRLGLASEMIQANGKSASVLNLADVATRLIETETANFS